MDIKMQKLIEKLNLSSDCINELKTGKLIKIVGNNTKTKYNFYIEIDNNITVESFKEFKEKLNESFNRILFRRKYNA